jgi:DNA-binding MarR family transcriptional regulator
MVSMVPEGEERSVGREAADPDLMDLRSTDVEVLRSLGADEALAFQGLRRRMHVHQEKLSRALQRLERDGLVAKTGHGYALTPKGAEMAHRCFAPAHEELRTILQSYLPTGADPAAIANHLEGRWFGNIRWLGSRETPTETVLRWVTFEPEVEVVLRLRWGQATVETSATEPLGMVEAFIAAQQIFSQLSGPWDEVGKPLTIST